MRTAGRGLPDFGVTAPRTWLASPSAPSPSRDHRTTTTIRVAVEVGPGQHETQRVVPLVEALDAKGMLPEKLAGDKGYSARWVREYLLAKGVEPVIPHQKSEPALGGPVERAAYGQRNLV